MEKIFFVLVGVLVFFIGLAIVPFIYTCFLNNILFVKHVKKKNPNLSFWQISTYSPEVFRYDSIDYNKNDKYILKLKRRSRKALKFCLVGFIGVVVTIIAIVLSFVLIPQ